MTDIKQQMTSRDRLIVALIRAVAVLLGKGKEFDAHVARASTMTTEELEAETERTKAKLHELTRPKSK